MRLLLGEMADGLDALRAEANRRIAAGQAPEAFDVLDAVEERARAFLAREATAPPASADPPR